MKAPLSTSILSIILTSLSYVPVFASGPGGVDGNLLWSSPYDSVDNYSLHHNFRPLIGLDSSGVRLAIPPSLNTLSQFTVFGVWFPAEGSQQRDFMSVTDSRGGQTVHNRDGASSSGISVEKSFPSEGKAVISCVRHASAPRHSLWNDANSPVISLGSLSPSSGFAGSFGDISLYGRVLSPFECAKIESILALRYGIDLNHSYYLGNTLVVDRNDYFKDNIIGIGNLPDIGFIQSRSYSLHNLTGGFVASGSYKDLSPLSGSVSELPMVISYDFTGRPQSSDYWLVGETDLQDNEIGDEYPGITFFDKAWNVFTESYYTKSYPSSPSESVNMDLKSYGRDGKMLAVQRSASEGCSLTLPEKGIATVSFSRFSGNKPIEISAVSESDKERRKLFVIESDSARIYGASKGVALPSSDCMISTDTLGGKLLLRLNGVSDTLLVSDCRFTNEDYLQIGCDPGGSSPLSLRKIRYGSSSYQGLSLDFPLSEYPMINRNTFLVKAFHELLYTTTDDFIIDRVDEIDEGGNGRAEFRHLDLCKGAFTLLRVDSILGEVSVMSYPDGFSELRVEALTGEAPYIFTAISEDSLTTMAMTSERSHTFADMPAGKYDIHILEQPGYRLVKAGKGFLPFTTSSAAEKTSLFQWMPQPDVRSLACGLAETGSSAVRFGFYISSDTVAMIRNGNRMPPINYSPESVFGISVSGNSVNYRINGQLVSTLFISNLPQFRCAMETADEGAILRSAVFSDDLIPDMTLPALIVEGLPTREFRASVEVEAIDVNVERIIYTPGNARPEQIFKTTAEESAKEDIKVVALGEFDFMASVVTNDVKSFAGSDFIVFDSAGRCVYRTVYNGESISFSVGTHGVYVAKVISPDGKELTGKFKTI